MLHEKYEPVIGLEVHCQLRTKTKMFSPDPVSYGGDPNVQVDPISLGHPGTLPMLNRKAVEYAIYLGIATHCQISERAEFARKHYFYPDLAKGYQITQYDTPLCFDGFLHLQLSHRPTDGVVERKTKPVTINRIHLEEDAARSVHDEEAGETLLDYNRAGVPLVELVTAPELRSPQEAAQFLKQLRQLVRYLRICDGNMEEGSLRCDANVSVRKRGQSELGTKCEIKNLNSISHLEQALEFEVVRQMTALQETGTVAPETRFWDESRGETRLLRKKETAPDYRFMADPDLPPVTITREQVKRIERELPELPAERRARFEEELGLSRRDAIQLTAERAIADFVEETIAQLYKFTRGGDTKRQAREVANFVKRDVLQALNERGISIDDLALEPRQLAELVYMRLEDELSSSGARDVFERLLQTDESAQEIASSRNLLQVSDREELVPIVEEVLERHSKNVQRYLDGKKGLIRFFMGQVMSNYDGSADPEVVRSLLEEKLEQKRS